MLPKAETEGFNRLVVSLGVLLATASLVVPWLVLGKIDVLLVSEDDYDDLRPVAQRAIRERQRLAANLTPEIWVVAVIVLLIGISMVVWGASRMRGQQSLDDERRRLEVERGKLEVRAMGLTPATEEDVERQMEREIVLDAADTGETVVIDRTSMSGTTITNEVSEPNPDVVETRRRRMDAARRISNEVVDRLSEFADNVMHDVRIKSVNSVIDAVAVVGPPTRSVFVEIKVVHSAKSGANRIRDAMGQLAPFLLASKNAKYEMSASGLVVIVIAADAEPGTTEAVAASLTRGGWDLGELGIAVSIVNEADIPTWVPAL